MAREKGLDIVRGYWPEIAPQLRGSFDIITGCNVLAHVADPTAFLAAALERLTDRGTIVLEFPYCREMIERSEWDTIYHEHLSYFLVGPFLKLVQRLDATVSNARLVPIHGGSLRVAIRRGASEHDASILKVAQDEESDGLYQMDTYRDFSKRVDRVCRDLQDLANSPSLDGRKLVAYGASAKGNTLLNRCSLPLSYIVDDNPLKHGLFTPGANVPIKQRAALGDEPSDLCVLLLAWNFADEIVANVKRLRPDRRDLAAVYIPDVRLFPI
jgi:hypothetical protein